VTGGKLWWWGQRPLALFLHAGSGDVMVPIPSRRELSRGGVAAAALLQAVKHALPPAPYVPHHPGRISTSGSFLTIRAPAPVAIELNLVALRKTICLLQVIKCP
jgi:hypothetical protein